MPSSFVTIGRSFFSGKSGSVSTLYWNWLPPKTSATRLAGRALAAKKPFSASVSAASLVMMPLMRQPSGSSVWHTADSAAPPRAGDPTAA